MELSILLPGIVVMLIGLLGWRFPKCINIFSKEEKMLMHLKGVGKLFRNIFVIAGAMIIVTAYLFPKTGVFAILFFTLITIFVFAYKAEKYKNKK